MKQTLSLPDAGSLATGPARQALQLLGKLRQRVNTAVGHPVCGPIGVDFARDRLHLVQIEYRAGRPLLRAVVSQAYPVSRSALLSDPRAARAFLRELRAAGPFVGAQVVSCLPSDAVRLLVLNFSLGENRDPAAAIVNELRERLKDELDTSIVDYLLIRSADGAETQSRSAIVAVATRSRVLAHLDMLAGAGLQPRALDIAPAALCRLVTASHQSSEMSNALLITFGVERSYFTVLWGRRLMVDRTVDFGESALVGRVARALDLDPAAASALLQTPEQSGEDDGEGLDLRDHGQEHTLELAATLDEIVHPAFARLAEEINRTLVYVASQTRGASVEKIYLVGGAARYPRIVGWLHRMVSVPVSLLDPVAALGAQDSAAQDGAVSIAVAAGLALRTFEGTPS